MIDFNKRIERLEELEAKATPEPWEYDTYESSHTGEICGYMTKPDIEDMLSGKDCDMAFSCALRNEALPLLRDIAKTLSDVQTENERLIEKQARLKDVLLPVCEYAAEIYNRGYSVNTMPVDTIRRLNSAFKMLG